MADAGGRRDDAEVVEGVLAPAQELVALPLRSNSRSALISKARALPNASTCTEWSITRSTGTSGLIFVGSPPSSSIASRIAARSTTAGTPVKSCISTRAGWKGISTDGSAFASQEAIASTSAAVNEPAVLQSQRVLEQHLERVGQPRDVEALLQGVEAKDLVLASRDVEGRARRRSCLRSYPQYCRWATRSTAFGLPGGDPVRGDLRRRPGRAPPCTESPARSWRCVPALAGGVGQPRSRTRSRSIARRPRRRPAAGVPVPTPGGAFGAVSANIPASRSTPGVTTETPTPVPRRSSRRFSAKPRRPNFVAAYSEAQASRLPGDRGDKDEVALAALAQPRSELARHPHRRLEVDAKGAADLLLARSSRVARGGQRRRWRPSRRRRRPPRAGARRALLGEVGDDRPGARHRAARRRAAPAPPPCASSARARPPRSASA